MALGGGGRKDTGTIGRGDVQGGDGTSAGGNEASSHSSPARAGVVIHATVEHVGLVGDTELSVSVNWPASIFCVQPCKKTAASADQVSDSQNVPANTPDALIYGESVQDLDIQKTIDIIRAKLAANPSESGEVIAKPELAELLKKLKPADSSQETSS